MFPPSFPPPHQKSHMARPPDEIPTASVRHQSSIDTSVGVKLWCNPIQFFLSVQHAFPISPPVALRCPLDRSEYLDPARTPMVSEPLLPMFLARIPIPPMVALVPLLLACPRFSGDPKEGRRTPPSDSLFRIQGWGSADYPPPHHLRAQKTVGLSGRHGSRLHHPCRRAQGVTQGDSYRRCRSPSIPPSNSWLGKATPVHIRSAITIATIGLRRTATTMWPILDPPSRNCFSCTRDSTKVWIG